MNSKQLNFDSLVVAIQNTHDAFINQAVKTVNICLSIRNWLIGYYIDEYELQGTDRANYGDYLLESLSTQLTQMGLKRMDVRELRRFRQFYNYYPQIRDSLNSEFKALSVMSKVALPEIRDSANPELKKSDLKLDGCLLIERLSFSHFVKLLQIESPLKRLFYEVESIRGHW
jgi:hypothetical protein